MEHNIVYNLMIRVIGNAKKNGTLDRNREMKKLDVFLARNKLSVEEYEELEAMMGGGKNA